MRRDNPVRLTVVARAAGLVPVRRRRPGDPAEDEPRGTRGAAGGLDPAGLDDQQAVLDIAMARRCADLGRVALEAQ